MCSQIRAIIEAQERVLGLEIKEQLVWLEALKKAKKKKEEEKVAATSMWASERCHADSEERSR